jgi:hypothetical protein
LLPGIILVTASSCILKHRGHIEVYCANYPECPEWRVTELKKIEKSETNFCKECSYVSSPSRMDSNVVGP